ncbi:Cytochrome C oxidase subunit IV [Solimonas aquatica]|uniref:Cytochrome C oxidase subunit IV n=1 Tax=Solimonas aquatica TaxID=489703 RepID=A0A1H9BDT1_9GAMM|nr:cytochrome C oxidase subunit IV family protein [Solimonas aquatica]SEP87029.1 Cytochrome C oxidase subunit IV [Solimonas aquatica]
MTPQRQPQSWGTQVWLLLMLATGISTWGLPKQAMAPAIATAALLLIAAFKVRLVLLHFMELREAPRRLRLLFEVWLLLLTATLLVLYLH